MAVASGAKAMTPVIVKHGVIAFLLLVTPGCEPVDLIIKLIFVTVEA